ncbi:unnamed protein product [marine sediment metagenome]|uniref:Uncharacterized protein n=1 Tax=marine sediment metagenome TaxID=412755 RepID=X1L8L1_9ZZZZ
MKLSKAQEKLGILADSFDEDCDKGWKLAINIGIEAIKQLQAIRHAHPAFWTFRLPGETPEESTKHD